MKEKLKKKKGIARTLEKLNRALAASAGEEAEVSLDRGLTVFQNTL